MKYANSLVWFCFKYKTKRCLTNSKSNCVDNRCININQYKVGVRHYHTLLLNIIVRVWGPIAWNMTWSMCFWPQTAETRYIPCENILMLCPWPKLLSNIRTGPFISQNPTNAWIHLWRRLPGKYMGIAMHHLWPHYCALVLHTSCMVVLCCGCSLNDVNPVFYGYFGHLCNRNGDILIAEYLSENL